MTYRTGAKVLKRSTWATMLALDTASRGAVGNINRIHGVRKKAEVSQAVLVDDELVIVTTMTPSIQDSEEGPSDAPSTESPTEAMRTGQSRGAADDG